MSFLHLARVAAVHPEDHSADIVMVDGSGRYVGVQVLALGAATNSGLIGLPSPKKSANPWGLSEKTGDDALAVVGFLAPGAPVILGFLYPQVNGMLFADGRKIDRHPSDAYSMTDDDGNIEVFHPSGTYIRIGESPEHEDLTGRDFDGNWAIKKNTERRVHVRVSVANGGATKGVLTITPDGDVSLQHDGDLSISTGGDATVSVGGDASMDVAGSASLSAADVTIDSPTTTVTGELEVQGLLTFTAGMQGSGGSGGVSATISGDVVVDGISSSHHRHGSVQSGTSTSGEPVA